MTNVLENIINGILAVLGWILILTVLGFIARINFEIFMFGWGFIK